MFPKGNAYGQVADLPLFTLLLSVSPFKQVAEVTSRADFTKFISRVI